MNQMWLDPADDPRMQGDDPRGERAVLAQYLDHYRTTLRLKCDDLTPAQLGTRSVPPSALSLLGLVRHLARVEHFWWRMVIEGQPLTRLFDDPLDETGFGFPSPDEVLVAAAWELLDSEIAHARSVWATADLDQLVDCRGDLIEVRDVIVHLIEEYARHCGHADLLRECIDGRTGQ